MRDSVKLQMALVFSSVPCDNIYNGHYWSGIFSGKTEKMAAGSDDFWVIFGIFFAGVLSIIDL